MINVSFNGEHGTKDDDPTRGWSLVILSIATSLADLAVGASVGLLGFSIWVPAVAIGVVTTLLTVLATRLGRTAGYYLGKWAERVGGLVLMAIGSRILMAHLVAG
jgi:manganese efflux pump family protein